MILRGLLILLLTISVIASSFAQKFLNFDTYNVDSLLLILPEQHAEERVSTLNNLAVSLYFEDFDLGEKYAEEALSLAKELDYQEGIANAFWNFGRMYAFYGNFPDALNIGFEALRIYEQLGKKNTVARLYADITMTHYIAGNFEKAIEYGQITLDKYREPLEVGATVGSVRDTIYPSVLLGVTYRSLGMFDKSLKIFLELHNAGKRNNFGNTEMVLYTFLVGSQFYFLGEMDSAKLYLEKALAYPDINQNVQALKYRPLTWLGFLQYKAGDFDTAVFHLRTAFEWYSKNGYLYWAIYVSNHLGRIHYEKNKMNSAEKYYRQSEMLFNEAQTKNSWCRYDSLKYIVSYGTNIYGPLAPRQMMEMMWIEGRSMYLGLYQISEAKKKTDDMLKYFIVYSDAKDTLNKIQRTRETLELQAKYESEIKDQQIGNLSKENEFKDTQLSQSRIILFGLTGLVILIVILALVLIRQNKLREQQKNLLLQQKLFRSQMNPHFLFNSLSSIHNFMLNENTVKAASYLSRFSKLVRAILNSSVEEYITLTEEISTIENYLELQKVRFPDMFDFTIEVDEEINPEITNIPSMLTQPFIENSIEHGIKHKNSKGNISVRFKMKDEMIVIDVEDDGVGRASAKEILNKQDKEHISLATAITIERIRVLNKKLKKKIVLAIKDLMNAENEPTGTKVILQIPYN